MLTVEAPSAAAVLQEIVAACSWTHCYQQQPRCLMYSCFEQAVTVVLPRFFIPDLYSLLKESSIQEKRRQQQKNCAQTHTTRDNTVQKEKRCLTVLCQAWSPCRVQSRRYADGPISAVHAFANTSVVIGMMPVSLLPHASLTACRNLCIAYCGITTWCRFGHSYCLLFYSFFRGKCMHWAGNWQKMVEIHYMESYSSCKDMFQ